MTDDMTGTPPSFAGGRLDDLEKKTYTYPTVSSPRWAARLLFFYFTVHSINIRLWSGNAAHSFIKRMCLANGLRLVSDHRRRVF